MKYLFHNVCGSGTMIFWLTGWSCTGFPQRSELGGRLVVATSLHPQLSTGPCQRKATRSLCSQEQTWWASGTCGSHTQPPSFVKSPLLPRASEPSCPLSKVSFLPTQESPRKNPRDWGLCPTSCLLRNRPQFGALPGARLLCNQRAVVLNKHYTGNVQSLPSSSLGPWGGSLSGRVSSTRNALICAVSVYGGMVQPSPCSSTATLASSAQVASKCGLPLGVSKPMGRDTYWVNCPHDISFSSKHMMIDSVSCSLMSHPLWPHEL